MEAELINPDQTALSIYYCLQYNLTKYTSSCQSRQYVSIMAGNMVKHTVYQTYSNKLSSASFNFLHAFLLSADFFQS